MAFCATFRTRGSSSSGFSRSMTSSMRDLALDAPAAEQAFAAAMVDRHVGSLVLAYGEADADQPHDIASCALVWMSSATTPSWRERTMKWSSRSRLVTVS